MTSNEPRLACIYLYIPVFLISDVSYKAETIIRRQCMSTLLAAAVEWECCTLNYVCTMHRYAV